MPTEFKLPELGEGVDSADVAQVLVSEGDEITAEQSVLEVETDKAVVEVPCPHAGRVAKVHVSAGDEIKVGQTLLTIDESGDGKPADKKESDAGEDKPAKQKSADKKPAKSSKQPAAGETEAEEKEPAPEAKAAAKEEPAKEKRDAKPSEPGAFPQKSIRPAPQDRPPQLPAAGPATRRLAHKLGVTLEKVDGTGPGQRITQEDVVRHHDAGGAAKGGVAALAGYPPLPDFSSEGPLDLQPFNKLNQTAIENLTRSWQLIPHVTQQGLADITDLESRRKAYNKHVGDKGPRVTVTAIAIKAAIAVLKEHPQFNASVDVKNKQLIIKKYYHVGVAVDTEHGLLVPVIRDADRKDTAEIAEAIIDLAGRARERKLKPEEMQGATFTISNQGGIGGTSFTPIVNWPEVAILGMSRSDLQPVVVDGEIAARLILPLSLSYDHRAANGADAARFIARLSELLSDSQRLMFEA